MQSYPFDPCNCMRKRRHTAQYFECVSNIARATFAYDNYCLRHWNEENERTKTSNWVADHFSLTIVELLLTWMLYFHVWLQKNEEIIICREYYNQFGIYKRFRASLLEPRWNNLSNPETYPDPYQKSKMECFAKIVNFFSLTPQVRCLTEFWIRICIFFKLRMLIRLIQLTWKFNYFKIQTWWLNTSFNFE